MLNSKDINFISKHIYCMDHDFYFWSMFMGEPSLTNGFLHYFDGLKVFICGYNLIPNLSNKKYNINILNLVRYYLKNYREIDFIEIWAIRDQLDDVLLDFLPWNYIKPNQHNVNMLFNFDEYNPKISKLYKYARNAKINYSKIKITKRKYLTQQHIKLIKSFLDDHQLNCFDYAYYGSLQGLMRSPYILIFEAWNEANVLDGFSVINTYFEKHPIFLMGFYDLNKKHVCDMLYLLILEYFKFSKADFLDIGYSINKTLYNYKMKWNPSIIFKPRGTLSFDIRKKAEIFDHWFPQLIIGDNRNDYCTRKRSYF